MSTAQMIVNLITAVLALMVAWSAVAFPLLRPALVPWLVFIALDWVIATLIIRAVRQRRSRDARR